MRMFFTAMSMLFFACAMSAAQEVQERSQPVQVMVLGSYHFTGGADLNTMEADDHLSPERQKEIGEVLDRLAAFAPNKIMVEIPSSDQLALNERYQSWRDGASEIGVNESDQIGMRLADRLGHSEIYAVDHRTDMDFQAMMTAAQDAGQMDLMSNFQLANVEVQGFMSQMEGLSVLDRLRLLNAPESKEIHSVYLTLAQMGSVENTVGAEQMSLWWGRNLRIFASVGYHSNPGDRVLVVFGQGHKYLLDQYFEAAWEYELISTDEVLY